MDATLSLAIVFATLLGPVLAVYVTRRGDDRRQQRSRRLDVFRMLMRSRRAVLSIDNVTALNMVEIEFHGVKNVLDAFGELHRHLNISPPQAPDWSDKRTKLQTKLLSQIGRHLGYSMEQLELLDGGYFPIGWQTIEDEQNQLRKLAIELLSSRRSLPVSEVPPTPPPPFPPTAPAVPPLLPSGLKRSEE